MKVYIVMREGPEWSSIVKAFENKGNAQTLSDKKNARVAKLNAQDEKDYRSIDERLSTYRVVTVPVYPTTHVEKETDHN